MKVENTLLSKKFYDYDEGESFVDEFNSYFMKIKDCYKMPDGSTVTAYKAVDLETGCVIEFENAQCFRPVTAKVVIE